ncbi:MAG: UDP-N-acetylglucosamine 1-carboxyvinyltransferase [Anaerovoracaceae bacterium]|nr:UDP-N-acetylglucosamine 1-carboxyvinyltransferase [Anaerovoracaceae bacterium]
MAKFVIQKSGPLEGVVEISGAKNAVLPILAATLLSSEKCVLEGVPALKDVDIMCDIIQALGVSVNRSIEESKVEIDASVINTSRAPDHLVEKMRASMVAMGPLLARMGKAEIHLPGGCAIGDRPIELHLKGLKALGAEIDISENGLVKGKTDGLVGTDIYLDFPSVGATENIVMAACLASGTTLLENAAQEPEIVDMCNFLNKMGARIKGAGTDTIKIEGVKSLRGARHVIIPDRIEAGTFMVAAAITRGTILVKNMLPDHVKPIIAKLRECGCDIFMTPEGVVVDASDRELKSTDIKTLPYPGFPTDIQSPFMALLTTVEGHSTVIETVFENRYMHVRELNKMGADISVKDRCAIINGGRPLKGTNVLATDLRAGAAVVLAGLVAEGVTEVSQIYHIERGYENFVEKITNLGGIIKRVDD